MTCLLRRTAIEKDWVSLLTFMCTHAPTRAHNDTRHLFVLEVQQVTSPFPLSTFERLKKEGGGARVMLPHIPHIGGIIFAMLTVVCGK